MQKIILVLAFVIIKAGLSQAQGTFQNLNFESAQLLFIDPPTNHLIATANALPGWSAFSGTNQLADVRYGIGGIVPVVYLSSQTNFGAIGGAFSVGLGNSPFFNIGSISQTALVPADAQSLLFEAIGSLGVSLGGQDLSYTAISNGLSSVGIPYTLYEAAFPSSFAGLSETLTFTAANSDVLLDDIQFSTVAIPEPSAISLLCLGSGVLFYARKRKRRSP